MKVFKQIQNYLCVMLVVSFTFFLTITSGGLAAYADEEESSGEPDVYRSLAAFVSELPTGEGWETLQNNQLFETYTLSTDALPSLRIVGAQYFTAALEDASSGIVEQMQNISIDNIERATEGLTDTEKQEKLEDLTAFLSLQSNRDSLVDALTIVLVNAIQTNMTTGTSVADVSVFDKVLEVMIKTLDTMKESGETEPAVITEAILTNVKKEVTETITGTTEIAEQPSIDPEGEAAEQLRGEIVVQMGLLKDHYEGISVTEGIPVSEPDWIGLGCSGPGEPNASYLVTLTLLQLGMLLEEITWAGVDMEDEAMDLVAGKQVEIADMQSAVAAKYAELNGERGIPVEMPEDVSGIVGDNEWDTMLDKLDALEAGLAAMEAEAADLIAGKQSEIADAQAAVDAKYAELNGERGIPVEKTDVSGIGGDNEWDTMLDKLDALEAGLAAMEAEAADLIAGKQSEIADAQTAVDAKYAELNGERGIPVEKTDVSGIEGDNEWDTMEDKLTALLAGPAAMEAEAADLITEKQSEIADAQAAVDAKYAELNGERGMPVEKTDVSGIEGDNEWDTMEDKLAALLAGPAAMEAEAADLIAAKQSEIADAQAAVDAKYAELNGDKGFDINKTDVSEIEGDNEWDTMGDQLAALQAGPGEMEAAAGEIIAQYESDINDIIASAQDVYDMLDREVLGADLTGSVERPVPIVLPADADMAYINQELMDALVLENNIINAARAGLESAINDELAELCTGLNAIPDIVGISFSGWGSSSTDVSGLMAEADAAASTVSGISQPMISNAKSQLEDAVNDVIDEYKSRINGIQDISGITYTLWQSSADTLSGLEAESAGRVDIISGKEEAMVLAARGQLEGAVNGLLAMTRDMLNGLDIVEGLTFAEWTSSALTVDQLESESDGRSAVIAQKQAEMISAAQAQVEDAVNAAANDIKSALENIEGAPYIDVASQAWSLEPAAENVFHIAAAVVNSSTVEADLERAMVDQARMQVEEYVRETCGELADQLNAISHISVDPLMQDFSFSAETVSDIEDQVEMLTGPMGGMLFAKAIMMANAKSDVNTYAGTCPAAADYALLSAAVGALFEEDGVTPMSDPADYMCDADTPGEIEEAIQYLDGLQEKVLAAGARALAANVAAMQAMWDDIAQVVTAMGISRPVMPILSASAGADAIADAYASFSASCGALLMADAAIQSMDTWQPSGLLKYVEFDPPQGGKTYVLYEDYDFYGNGEAGREIGYQTDAGFTYAIRYANNVSEEARTVFEYNELVDVEEIYNRETNTIPEWFEWMFGSPPLTGYTSYDAQGRMTYRSDYITFDDEYWVYDPGTGSLVEHGILYGDGGLEYEIWDPVTANKIEDRVEAPDGGFSANYYRPDNGNLVREELGLADGAYGYRVYADDETFYPDSYDTGLNGVAKARGRLEEMYVINSDGSIENTYTIEYTYTDLPAGWDPEEWDSSSETLKYVLARTTTTVDGDGKFLEVAVHDDTGTVRERWDYDYYAEPDDSRLQRIQKEEDGELAWIEEYANTSDNYMMRRAEYDDGEARLIEEYRSTAPHRLETRELTEEDAPGIFDPLIADDLTGAHVEYGYLDNDDLDLEYIKNLTDGTRYDITYSGDGTFIETIEYLIDNGSDTLIEEYVYNPDGDLIEKYFLYDRPEEGQIPQEDPDNCWHKYVYDDMGRVVEDHNYDVTGRGDDLNNDNWKLTLFTYYGTPDEYKKHTAEVYDLSIYDLDNPGENIPEVIYTFDDDEGNSLYSKEVFAETGTGTVIPGMPESSLENDHVIYYYDTSGRIIEILNITDGGVLYEIEYWAENDPDDLDISAIKLYGPGVDDHSDEGYREYWYYRNDGSGVAGQMLWIEYFFNDSDGNWHDHIYDENIDNVDDGINRGRIITDRNYNGQTVYDVWSPEDGFSGAYLETQYTYYSDTEDLVYTRTVKSVDYSADPEDPETHTLFVYTHFEDTDNIVNIKRIYEYNETAEADLVTEKLTYRNLADNNRLNKREVFAYNEEAGENQIIERHFHRNVDDNEDEIYRSDWYEDGLLNHTETYYTSGRIRTEVEWQQPGNVIGKLEHFEDRDPEYLEFIEGPLSGMSGSWGRDHQSVTISGDVLSVRNKTSYCYGPYIPSEHGGPGGGHAYYALDDYRYIIDSATGDLTYEWYELTGFSGSTPQYSLTQRTTYTFPADGMNYYDKLNQALQHLAYVDGYESGVNLHPFLRVFNTYYSLDDAGLKPGTSFAVGSRNFEIGADYIKINNSNNYKLDVDTGYLGGMDPKSSSYKSRWATMYNEIEAALNDASITSDEKAALERIKYLLTSRSRELYMQVDYASNPLPDSLYMGPVLAEGYGDDVIGLRAELVARAGGDQELADAIQNVPWSPETTAQEWEDALVAYLDGTELADRLESVLTGVDADGANAYKYEYYSGTDMLKTKVCYSAPVEAIPTGSGGYDEIDFNASGVVDIVTCKYYANEANMVESKSFERAAGDFDGVDDYIELTRDEFDQGFTQRSAAFWFKTNDPASTTEQVIFEEGGGANGMNIYYRNGKICAGAWSEDNLWDGAFLEAELDVSSADEWNHVAIVFDSDAGTFKLYLNGVERASADAPVAMYGHGNPDAIGAVLGNTVFESGVDTTVSEPCSYTFNGKIDDAGIWTAALTPAEILDIMHNGPQVKEAALYSNLFNEGETNRVMYIHYDETVESGAEIYDGRALGRIDVLVNNYADSDGAKAYVTDYNPSNADYTKFTYGYAETIQGGPDDYSGLSWETRYGWHVNRPDHLYFKDVMHETDIDFEHFALPGISEASGKRVRYYYRNEDFGGTGLGRIYVVDNYDPEVNTRCWIDHRGSSGRVNRIRQYEKVTGYPLQSVYYFNDEDFEGTGQGRLHQEYDHIDGECSVYTYYGETDLIKIRTVFSAEPSADQDPDNLSDDWKITLTGNIATCTYYENEDNRMKSKAFAQPAENGDVYLHFKDDEDIYLQSSRPFSGDTYQGTADYSVSLRDVGGESLLNVQYVYKNKYDTADYHYLISYTLNIATGQLGYKVMANYEYSSGSFYNYHGEEVYDVGHQYYDMYLQTMTNYMNTSKTYDNTSTPEAYDMLIGLLESRSFEGVDLDRFRTTDPQNRVDIRVLDEADPDGATAYFYEYYGDSTLVKKRYSYAGSAVDTPGTRGDLEGLCKVYEYSNTGSLINIKSYYDSHRLKNSVDIERIDGSGPDLTSKTYKYYNDEDFITGMSGEDDGAGCEYSAAVSLSDDEFGISVIYTDGSRHAYSVDLNDMSITYNGYVPGEGVSSGTYAPGDPGYYARQTELFYFISLAESSGNTQAQQVLADMVGDFMTFSDLPGPADGEPPLVQRVWGAINTGGNSYALDTGTTDLVKYTKNGAVYSLDVSNPGNIRITSPSGTYGTADGEFGSVLAAMMEDIGVMRSTFDGSETGTQELYRVALEYMDMILGSRGASGLFSGSFVIDPVYTNGRLAKEVLASADAEGAIAYEYEYHGGSDMLSRKACYREADMTDPDAPVLSVKISEYDYDINGNLAVSRKYYEGSQRVESEVTYLNGIARTYKKFKDEAGADNRGRVEREVFEGTGEYGAKSVETLYISIIGNIIVKTFYASADMTDPHDPVFSCIIAQVIYDGDTGEVLSEVIYNSDPRIELARRLRVSVDELDVKVGSSWVPAENADIDGQSVVEIRRKVNRDYSEDPAIPEDDRDPVRTPGWPRRAEVLPPVGTYKVTISGNQVTEIKYDDNSRNGSYDGSRDVYDYDVNNGYGGHGRINRYDKDGVLVAQTRYDAGGITGGKIHRVLYRHEKDTLRLGTDLWVAAAANIGEYREVLRLINQTWGSISDAVNDSGDVVELGLEPQEFIDLLYEKIEENKGRLAYSDPEDVTTAELASKLDTLITGLGLNKNSVESVYNGGSIWSFTDWYSYSPVANNGGQTGYGITVTRRQGTSSGGAVICVYTYFGTVEGQEKLVELRFPKDTSDPTDNYDTRCVFDAESELMREIWDEDMCQSAPVLKFSYEYDSNGNVTDTHVFNRWGMDISWAWNGEGYLIEDGDYVERLVQWMKGTEVENYSSGNLKKMTQPNGAVWEFMDEDPIHNTDTPGYNDQGHGRVQSFTSNYSVWNIESYYTLADGSKSNYIYKFTENSGRWAKTFYCYYKQSDHDVDGDGDVDNKDLELDIIREYNMYGGYDNRMAEWKVVSKSDYDNYPEEDQEDFNQFWTALFTANGMGTGTDIDNIYFEPTYHEDTNGAVSWYIRPGDVITPTDELAQRWSSTYYNHVKVWDASANTYRYYRYNSSNPGQYDFVLDDGDAIYVPGFSQDTTYIASRHNAASSSADNYCGWIVAGRLIKTWAENNDPNGEDGYYWEQWVFNPGEEHGWPGHNRDSNSHILMGDHSATMTTQNVYYPSSSVYVERQQYYSSLYNTVGAGTASPPYIVSYYDSSYYNGINYYQWQSGGWYRYTYQCDYYYYDDYYYDDYYDYYMGYYPTSGQWVNMGRVEYTGTYVTETVGANFNKLRDALVSITAPEGFDSDYWDYWVNRDDDADVSQVSCLPGLGGIEYIRPSVGGPGWSVYTDKNKITYKYYDSISVYNCASNGIYQSYRSGRGNLEWIVDEYGIKYTFANDGNHRLIEMTVPGTDGYGDWTYTFYNEEHYQNDGDRTNRSNGFDTPGTLIPSRLNYGGIEFDNVGRLRSIRDNIGNTFIYEAYRKSSWIGTSTDCPTIVRKDTVEYNEETGEIEEASYRYYYHLDTNQHDTVDQIIVVKLDPVTGEETNEVMHFKPKPDDNGYINPGDYQGQVVNVNGYALWYKRDTDGTEYFYDWAKNWEDGDIVSQVFDESSPVTDWDYVSTGTNPWRVVGDALQCCWGDNNGASPLTKSVYIPDSDGETVALEFMVADDGGRLLPENYPGFQFQVRVNGTVINNPNASYPYYWTAPAVSNDFQKFSITLGEIGVNLNGGQNNTIEIRWMNDACDGADHDANVMIKDIKIGIAHEAKTVYKKDKRIFNDDILEAKVQELLSDGYRVRVNASTHDSIVIHTGELLGKIVKVQKLEGSTWVDVAINGSSMSMWTYSTDDLTDNIGIQSKIDNCGNYTSIEIRPYSSYNRAYIYDDVNANQTSLVYKGYNNCEQWVKAAFDADKNNIWDPDILENEDGEEQWEESGSPYHSQSWYKSSQLNQNYSEVMDFNTSAEVKSSWAYSSGRRSLQKIQVMNSVGELETFAVIISYYERVAPEQDRYYTYCYNVDGVPEATWRNYTSRTSFTNAGFTEFYGGMDYADEFHAVTVTDKHGAQVDVMFYLPPDGNGYSALTSGAPQPAYTQSVFVDEASMYIQGDELLPENQADWFLGGYQKSAGAGVSIALLDTGVNTDELGVSVSGYDFAGENRYTGEGDEDFSDPMGHGTKVASVIKSASGGIAREADIMALKVFDDAGLTSNTVIADAVKYAVDNGSKILSMSFGLYGMSSVLEEAIDYAAERGAIIITSAGNEGEAEFSDSLAGHDNVITVGSVDSDGKLSAWSNYGSEVDLYAPWDVITIDGAEGEAGTSYSAAFVAGIAALMMADDPDMTALEVIEELKKMTAENVADYADYKKYGAENTVAEEEMKEETEQPGGVDVDEVVSKQEAQRANKAQFTGDNIKMDEMKDPNQI